MHYTKPSEVDRAWSMVCLLNATRDILVRLVFANGKAYHASSPDFVS